MANNRQQQQQPTHSRRKHPKKSPVGRQLRSASSMDSKDSTGSAAAAHSPGPAHSAGKSSSCCGHDQQRGELTKVTILGAAGGIGQPLAMLLMLHSEYVQHVAMHDLVDSIPGIGLDVSHIDRRCKITSHLGQETLAEAVRGSKVVLIPAGLAQKPGMSRDDLFGSNAKILFNLVKVCAQEAPNAMLAIITNPVNSLVPIACEVYNHYATLKRRSDKASESGQVAAAQKSIASHGEAKSTSSLSKDQQEQQQISSAQKSTRSDGGAGGKSKFQEVFRRIFGVTTLDVVRASTLTAKSTLFKGQPNGMFKDPLCVKVPVVGGHAGKTIIPLLSQATPKLNRKHLVEDKTTTMTLVESIQQAGIEVLNAKKGKGSATIAMAYAACRFTLSLLRAMQGEPNVVECAYVHQPVPLLGDLDYFATPLVLGKDGYSKSLGIPGQAAAAGGKEQPLLPYEIQMLEEGARELRSSIARGEDFAREHLSSEK